MPSAVPAAESRTAGCRSSLAAAGRRERLLVCGARLAVVPWASRVRRRGSRGIRLVIGCPWDVRVARSRGRNDERRGAIRVDVHPRGGLGAETTPIRAIDAPSRSARQRLCWHGFWTRGRAGAEILQAGRIATLTRPLRARCRGAEFLSICVRRRRRLDGGMSVYGRLQP